VGATRGIAQLRVRSTTARALLMAAITMNKVALLALAASATLYSTDAFAQGYAPVPAPAPAPNSFAPAPWQPPPPARPFPDRQGFTIGFSIGPGWLNVDDEEIDIGTTSALSFRLGGAITPNILIQGNLEGVGSSDADSDTSVTLAFLGASVTGYLHPRVYLVGGLGLASVGVERGGNSAESEDVLGLLAGVGVEVYQSNNFGLSLEARTLTASIDDSRFTGHSLQLGFQWW
jgi:hypothetical protein